MSSFIKKLFGNKEKKGKHAPIAQTPASPDSSKSSSVPEVIKECQFSDDTVGKGLNEAWENFNRLLKDQIAGQSDKGKSEENQAFLDLMSLFCRGYSEVKSMRSDSSDKRFSAKITSGSLLQPTNFMDTFGHPTLFVLQIPVYLLDLLAFESKRDPRATFRDSEMSTTSEADDAPSSSSNSKKPGDPAGLNRQNSEPSPEINLARIFPDTLLERVTSAQPFLFAVDVETCAENRRRFVLTLKCLSVVARWPHNCSILKNNLGKEFVKFFMTILNLLSQKLDQIYKVWNELDRSLKEGSEGPARLSFLSSSLEFTVTSMLYCVQFISVSTDEGGELPFNDLLPPQPWNETDLQYIGVMATSQTSPPIRVRTESSSSVRSTSPSSRSGAVTPALAGKQVFVQYFVDSGAVSQAILILRQLSSLIDEVTNKVTSTSESTAAAETDFPRFAWSLVKGFTVLQTECLFLLHVLMSRNVNSIVRFNQDNSYLILNNLLMNHPSHGLLDSDPIIERVALRKGLLCLRLNNLLSSQPSNLLSEEYAVNYYSMLELSAICEFLFWLSHRFDELERYDEDLKPFYQVADPEKLRISVECLKTFQSTPLVFDLWPWELTDATVESDHIIDLSETTTYYHLTPQPTTLFLSDTIKTLAGYVAWDAVIQELVGSFGFSQLSAATMSVLSPNAARKPNKKNLYFVFAVFHHLFEEKIAACHPQHHKKPGAVHCVHAHEVIPLCQLRFSEYMMQLFKTSDAEDIFSAISEFEVFHILFGEMFLLGHCAQLSVPAALSVEKKCFDNISVSNLLLTKTSWSKANGVSGNMTYFWILLHNNALDFLNGLVVYSLYFQGTKDTVRAFMSFDEVMTLLVDYISSHRSSSMVESGQIVEKDKRPLNNIIYQMVLLLHNLSETISTLGEKEKDIIRNRIVSRLIELCEVKIAEINSIDFADPASPTNAVGSALTGPKFTDPLDWPACSAIVTLILQLTSMSKTSNADWAAIFGGSDSYIPEPTVSNEDTGGKDSDPDSTPTTSTASMSESSSLISKMSFASKPVSMKPFDSPQASRSAEESSVAPSTAGTVKETAPHDGLSQRAKNRIKSLFTILSEPRTRAAGIHLLIDIICTSIGVKVDPSGGRTQQFGDVLKKKQNKAVVSETIKHVLSIVGHAPRYPECCNGAQMAIDILSSLTWLMRASKFQAVRKVLQEYFRPFILDILTALKACLKGFDDRLNRKGGVSKEMMSKILRQGLAFLTGILTANELSKSEFGLISQPTKENTEFTSHLFGNFRNVDKIKKLQAPSAKMTVVTTTKSGFENLKDLILTGEKVPTRETVIVLFEMLLDGHYALAEHCETENPLFMNDDDRPKIKNTHLIPDIFGLVPHCNAATQAFILISFHNLIKGRASLVNLNACSLSKPRVIDLALDLFPNISDEIQVHNVYLIQSLGKHGISVAMLKHLFRVLQSKGESRPAYSWRVIQALQGMITEEDGPRQTFVFEGTKSGLKLPPVYKWPAQKAYSFCAWLKIEAPKVASSRFSVKRGARDKNVQNLNDIYCPYILCLRNSSGAGMELYLRPSKMVGMFKVVLKIHSDIGETSTLSPELKGMKIAEGRWHFLAFSVSSPSFYSKGEACIHLDDQFIRHTFNFVKLPDTIPEPLIGDCVESLRIPGQNCTMRGQMGAFYLFSEALSEGQFRSIHALGPDYIYNFEHNSALYQSTQNSSSKVQRVDPVLSILDGSLTSHIVLAFNPVVWKGEYFLDNTPLKNDVRWKVPMNVGVNTDDILYDSPGYCKMHALRLKGTYRSITQDVRLALNSLGGIKTVFPLFAQLDQPRITPSPVGLGATPAPLTSDNSHDPNFLPAIFGLLINLLEFNAENQQIFIKLSGFQIVAHLLERASPENFGSLTLDRMIELFNKLDSCSPLQEIYLEQILCNFKFWVFTPLSIQLRLFGLLGELMTLNSNYIVESLQFQRLVDLLYLLYDYAAPNIDRTEFVDDFSDSSGVTPRPGGFSFSRNSSSRDLSIVRDVTKNFLKGTIYSSDVWIRASTGEVLGTKLKGSELLQVRSRIFTLLNNLLQINKAFLPEDVNALVAYLIHTTSAVSKIEILTFMLNLLKNEVSNFLAPHMLLGFAVGNSMKLLNTLYSHENVQVRLLTLTLFCRVVTLSLDYKLLPDIPKASKFYSQKIVVVAPGNSQDFDSSGSNPSTPITVSIDRSPAKITRETTGNSEVPVFLDTLEAMNLHPSNLLSILLFTQDQLLSKLAKDSKNSRALQTKIIAHALQLTMFGESCTYLQSHIMEIWGDSGSVEVNLNDEACCVFHQNLDAAFEEMQKNRAPGAVMCIPMNSLSLMAFVSNDNVNASLRSSVLKNLEGIVSRNSRNCDRILTMTCWQEYILGLMVSESKRIAAAANQPDSDLDLSVSEAIKESCVQILCDIQLMAIKIGRSLSSQALSRQQSGAKELTPMEVIKSITRGERQLGVAVLKESMVFLYTFKDLDETEGRKTGLKLLTRCIAELVEQSALNARPAESSVSAILQVSDILHDHAEKILHLNIWLISSVIFDVLDGNPAKSPKSRPPSELDDADSAVLCSCIFQLLKLVSPLDDAIPNWMFEEKSFRVQAGFFESVEKLILPVYASVGQTASSSISKAGYSAKQRMPLCFAAGGMYWMMIRVLCRFHLRGGSTVSDTVKRHSIVESDSNLLILSKVKQLLKASEKYPDFYEGEALYVLSLFSESLRGSNTLKSRQWVVETSELVVDIATSLKECVLRKVTEANNLEQSVERLSILDDKTRPNLANLALEVEISPCYNSLISSLCQALELMVDVPTAASMWTSLTSKLLNNCIIIDESLLKFRYNELGIQTVQGTTDAMPGIKPMKMSDAQQSGEWYIVSHTWKSNCIESQNMRLRDLIKQWDSLSRRIDSKWTRIITELTNERGPWGYGADQREVFWMLDNIETNLRLKMRLKRNEFGTRHMMATTKSFGRHMYSTESNLNGLQNPAGGEGEQSSGRLQGFYKDLKKYKKLSSLPFSQEPSISGEAATPETADHDEYSDVEDENNLLDNTASVSDTTEVDVVLYSGPAEVITAATNSSGGHTLGKLEVTKSRVTFSRNNENEVHDFINKTGNTEFMWACQCYPTTTWTGEEIWGIYERQYQTRNVAIELFFTSRTSVFFNLFDVKKAKKLYRTLRKSLKTPHLNLALAGRPKVAILKNSCQGMTPTQAWVQHKITNFEYLNLLNLIAGRTFNDLAQYPVFPWVLADYTSPRIDLRDPKFFRDFKWPMGAQLDNQRQLLMDKYEASLSLQDDEILPYHTGSHYSTAAMVIWYLLRMEPFTSYHVWLQDGKFDRPDRLFHSIDSTWKGCTTNPQDVKELIPEFFCNPEFLENVNDINFGVRQNGKPIDNVDMPAWCKDASDFVRINREALESDYVSRNLHHWIDLIFGFKQRPPHVIGGSEECVKACNCFVHLTYNDAVNLEEIKATDEVLYERTIRQIDNYGQCPVQLFDKPHPERLPVERVDITWPIASIVTGVDSIPKASAIHLDKPSKVLCYGEFRVSSAPILLIAVSSLLEKLVTVDSSRVIGYHTFQARQPDIVPPFLMKVDKTAMVASSHHGKGMITSLLSINASNKEKLAGVPFASQGVLSQNQTGKFFASMNDFDYELIGTPANKEQFLEEEHLSRVKLIDSDKRMTNSRSAALLAGSENSSASRTKKIRVVEVTSMDLSGSNHRSRNPSVTAGSASTTTANTTATAGSGAGSAAVESLVDQLTTSDNVKHPKAATKDRSASSPAPASSSTSGTAVKVINRRERVDDHLSCNLYALLGDSKLLFSCAHWDNSFKVTTVDGGRLIQSVSHHREIVTCLTLASDFGRHWLVTGSKDCIVIVWDVNPEKEVEPVNTTPIHILYGHDDSVNCLAVNPELDLIVSGSDDGTIIIHSLREGMYLRSILIGISQSMYAKAVTSTLSGSSAASGGGGGGSSSGSSGSSRRTASSKTSRSEPQIYKRRVHLVVISKDGYIITYSNDGNLLSTHTMNGRYVKMVDVKERIYSMCLSEDGKVLITGGERCLVVIRWVNNLTLANNGPRKDLDSVIDGSHDPEHGPFLSPIRSLCLTNQERHLIVGLESGHIRILAQDSEYLRRKLHRKLMEIGILTF